MRARPSSQPRGGAPRTTRLPLVLGIVLALAIAGLLAAGVGIPFDDRAPRVATTGDPAPSSPTTPTAVSSTPSPTATPTPSTTPPERAAGALPDVDRLTADDRYALSVAASRETIATGRAVPVVYLVADDALDLGWAAVPAAAAREGTVLLTGSDRLPPTVTTELKRLAPTEIVLVGDDAAISDAVALAAGRLAPRVTRVDHADPADAAREITGTAFPTAREVWVAAVNRTADLATASAVAAGRGAPMLVLSEDAVAPTAADLALVRVIGADTVTLVGADSLATAHAAAWGGAPAAAAYVADPGRATDAFTGAVLAGGARAPLVWALPYCLPTASRDAVLAPSVAAVTIIGGERSVRSSVDRYEECRSVTDPASTWVLVNKRNGLSPGRFEPTGLTVPDMPHADGHRLRTEAAAALAAMASASVEAGAGRIGIDTAYRSFETQEALYDRFLARRGRAWTDRWYLRAGFSEHQTGLTVDLLPIGRAGCTINDCIDETPQGVWLAQNSWRFGYILRYERGRTSVTGVGFEPWHFRYVGEPLAKAYREGGWHTYEQFLGQPAAPTY